MIAFKKRSEEEEAMDDPGLKEADLDEVFNDLNRTNQLLAGQYITLQATKRLLDQGIPACIADMGCGDGDLLRRLADYCRKIGIEAIFTGIDNSEAALAIARRKSVDYPEISYKKEDLLHLDPGDNQYDILLCTLTLHHFADPDIKVLLGIFSRCARKAIVIQDLQRNKIAYYLFQLFSLIFIKTEIAREDGLISIRSGFRKRELIRFAEGLSEWRHSIRWRWLFRYLWVIQAKAPKSYD
ncbi:MAG: methyltransferase domain-containing protein [Flavobacteriaceae bacterium]|nr:methyltransferase domain-containing protein [Flavobacteriaceae bacterium]